jgi:hypothetical protein
MRPWLLVAVLALGCSGKPGATTPIGNDPEPAMGSNQPPAHDSRTAIEQRRDVACKALGPRITKCAVEDAKVAAQKGEITQKQLTDISTPEVLAKNTAEFVEKCEAPMSSRQVRVLEVCEHSETDCAPLLACLEHLHDPGK